MNSSRRFLQVALLLALVGVVAVGILLHTLQGENQALLENNEKARKGGKQDLASQLAKRNDELKVLRVQVQDLLRLRHELRLLRSATNDMARLQDENRRLKQVNTNAVPPTTPDAVVVATGDPEEFVARQNWTFSGYATPEATLQSWMWSLREGDLDAFLATLMPEDRARFESQLQQSNKSEEELSAELKRQGDGLNGFQILDEDSDADGTIVILARISGNDSARHRFIFTRNGTEWKMADAGVDQ
ncbi:MAG TPA: hypothetical protein VN281_17100 [Verrucomicrobiae bacterium]|jgi:hypothetical protein|nr:hypothetical protein [Verrucomicrobiae bacterium]